MLRFGVDSIVISRNGSP